MFFDDAFLSMVINDNNNFTGKSGTSASFLSINFNEHLLYSDIMQGIEVSHLLIEFCLYYARHRSITSIDRVLSILCKA